MSDVAPPRDLGQEQRIQSARNNADQAEADRLSLAYQEWQEKEQEAREEYARKQEQGEDTPEEDTTEQEGDR